MVQFWVGAGLFGVLALLMVIRIRKLQFLQREGVPATGTVLTVMDTRAGPTASRVKTESVIQFRTPDGRERRFRTRGALTGEVEVVYDPAKPKRVEVTRNLKTGREWFGLAFFGLFMVGFVVAAVAA